MINPIIIDGINYDKQTVKELVKYLKCAFDATVHNKDYESAKRFKHIGLLLVNYGMNLNATTEACSFQECLTWFTFDASQLAKNSSSNKESFEGHPIYKKDDQVFFNDGQGNVYMLDVETNKWLNVVNKLEYPN